HSPLLRRIHRRMRVKRWQNLLRFVDAGAFLDEIVVLAITPSLYAQATARPSVLPLPCLDGRRTFFSSLLSLPTINVLPTPPRQTSRRLRGSSLPRHAKAATWRGRTLPRARRWSRHGARPAGNHQRKQFLVNR